MTTVYYDQSISRYHAGFGMYQSDPENGEPWAEAIDLVDYMRQCAAEAGQEFYELGVDELPPGVDDIRGSIYSEPDRVFAFVWHDKQGEVQVSYEGIVAREVS